MIFVGMSCVLGCIERSFYEDEVLIIACFGRVGLRLSSANNLERAWALSGPP